MNFWLISLFVVASLLVDPSSARCTIEMRNLKSRFLSRDTVVLCRNFGSIPGSLHDEIGNLTERHQDNPVRVDVLDSDIPTIPTDGFVGLSNVGELRLEGINIVQVNANAFHGLTNMSRLSLRKNKIVTLYKYVFGGTDLDNLTELDISENELTDIEEGTFQALRRLQLLHINDNLLVTLPEKLFQSSSVSMLDLSRNKIQVFQKGFFWGLRDLKILLLTNNSLVAIQPDLFARNDKLIQVQMERNFLEDVRNLTLPTAKFLNLSSCHLRTLAHSNFEEVETLDLSDNGLASLDEVKLDSLVDLNLKRNFMKFSDFFSSNMRNVERLILSENNLQHMDVSMFQFYGLKYLDASKNLLNHLETYRFTALQTLILHHNSLTRLKLSVMRELQELDLSYNRFSEIQHRLLENLGNLRRLDMSNNQIRNISLGSFKDLSHLHYMDLSNNNIETLEIGVFVGLTNMDFLDLSYNSLTALDEGLFHSFRGVRSLNISFNNIRYDTARYTFSHFQYNSDLNLEGNGWSCDEIVAFIRENNAFKISDGSATNVTNIRGIACMDSPPDEPAKGPTDNFATQFLSKLSMNNTLLGCIVAITFFKLLFDGLTFRHKLINRATRTSPAPAPQHTPQLFPNIRSARQPDEFELINRNVAEEAL